MNKSFCNSVLIPVLWHESLAPWLRSYGGPSVQHDFGDDSTKPKRHGQIACAAFLSRMQMLGVDPDSRFSGSSSCQEFQARLEEASGATPLCWLRGGYRWLRSDRP